MSPTGMIGNSSLSGDNAFGTKGGNNFKGKRTGGSRNTPLTGNTQNPKSPGGVGLLTPTKNLNQIKPTMLGQS